MSGSTESTNSSDTATDDISAGRPRLSSSSNAEQTAVLLRGESLGILDYVVSNPCFTYI